MSDRLYMMIGLARSGKSTLSRRWLNREIDFTIDGSTVASQFNLEPRVVVCADEWRLALGHRYNSYLEPMIHPQVRIAVRALLHTHNVLIDETNTNRMSIIQWLEEDIDAIPVFVNTLPSLCKERALKSNQPDLVPVIDRMAINLTKTFGGHLDIHGTVSKLREEAMIRNSFNRIVV